MAFTLAPMDRHAQGDALAQAAAAIANFMMRHRGLSFPDAAEFAEKFVEAVVAELATLPCDGAWH